MTQASISKPTGGVLPISASATQKNASTPSKSSAKPPTPRLKLLVRRLPPGLTQVEFQSALGEEWKLGAGKVDWFQYKEGKVSKDPAKPSRPSRAYLRVASEQYIGPLAEKVGRTSFLDSRNTAGDPVLLGPPSLEFAPFARVPGSRVRKDARQGTIDQDPEFIDFLESLTNPITKPAPVEATADGEKAEAVTTTPLVQYIKEKKANKTKESASSAKGTKHGRSEKDSKPEKVQAKKLLQRPDKDVPPTTSTTDKKAKSEKATKEAIKVANKQAANVAAKASAKTPPATTSKETSAQTSAPERKRERGNLSAAARIVQRDLGLAPPGNRRRGGKSTTTSTDTDASKTGGSSQEPVSSPAAGKQPAAARSSKEAKETAATQKSATEKASGATPSQSTVASSTVRPASSAGKSSKSVKSKQPAPTGSTQAFLKHANPSQGVTEPLLEAAFASFGRITKVEIDKKKGFGYIDFAEPEGLQKAIAASPVSVAQGQVVVLERKSSPSAEKSRGKGRNEQQSPSSRGKSGSSGGGRGAGGGESSQSTPRGSRGSRGGSKNKNSNNNKGGGTGSTANAATAESK
ncbi:hypothetical protein DTO164E3_3452 [Paecilomyces variotii]|nr:hypothetical protein DTO164E3_3452 [Paecilomyces variotii]KAJ9204853.1 hypothetical protein DTO032I3_2598 [Paecilomyces variotii]KAJ9219944.1 hypothetical protein DTO169C6_7712 [Paecilomyces variotii]KAJ9279779.1 hypothetical protein DTO021D3_3284 [Paecilomyces variotii]KAJ9285787.1 hypothetical protein DTO021C3_6629 [Paecilomyces variotii]